MELEFEGGARIPIGRNSTEIGRELGLGFGVYSSDRTVSRSHLSLQHLDDDESRVSFHVIGKNPIWVCRGDDGETALFRNSESGELRAGDRFSLSLKDPKFISVWTREGGEEGGKRKGVLDAVERTERRTRERMERGRIEDSAAVDELELDLGWLNVPRIDPVKEFAFLVKGHEFDCYPRQKIRAFKDWNFFLEKTIDSNDDEDEDEDDEDAEVEDDEEEDEDDDEDDEDEDDDEDDDDEEEEEEGVVGGVSKWKKSEGRKKRKSKENENQDDNWTDESEDEKEVVAKLRSGKRARNSTRSEDRKKSQGNQLDGGAEGSNVNIAEEDDDQD